MENGTENQDISVQILSDLSGRLSKVESKVNQETPVLAEVSPQKVLLQSTKT